MLRAFLFVVYVAVLGGAYWLLPSAPVSRDDEWIAAGDFPANHQLRAEDLSCGSGGRNPGCQTRRDQQTGRYLLVSKQRGKRVTPAEIAPLPILRGTSADVLIHSLQENSELASLIEPGTQLRGCFESSLITASCLKKPFEVIAVHVPAGADTTTWMALRIPDDEGRAAFVTAATKRFLLVQESANHRPKTAAATGH
jgi:hypothetical protein